MEEIFICNECLKFARNPVSINCQHTFCEACAKQLIPIGFIHTHKKDVFLCPVCKVKTQLSQDYKFEINREL